MHINGQYELSQRDNYPASILFADDVVGFSERERDSEVHRGPVGIRLSIRLEVPSLLKGLDYNCMSFIY